MIAYNVKDWFWLIGITPVQVYSSRLGAYLDFTHPDYVAFLTNEGMATRIDTESNLADVLKYGEVPNWYECYTDLTLEQAKLSKELEIRAKGSTIMLQIVSPYSAEERDTWPSQVAEAKAYTDNPLASTPMLTALCAQRGNTVADQAARILGNEAAFKTAVGQVLGIQQAKLDLIAAATTVEEVNAVAWGV